MDKDVLDAIPNGPVNMTGPGTASMMKRPGGRLELYYSIVITVNGVAQTAKFKIGEIQPTV